MAPRLGRRPFRFIFHVLGHVLVLQKGKEKDKEEKNVGSVSRMH